MAAWLARGVSADGEQLIDFKRVGYEGGVGVPGYALADCD